MTVNLVWITPSAEQMIGDMARVSAPENQGKDSTKLIHYLMSNQHWSPLEMANACFEIETTRDIARQLLRHRSFTFQEFSQRYASTDKLPEAPLREARMQDVKDRQNSLNTATQDQKDYWRMLQRQVVAMCNDVYKEGLELGIAKEVARAVLPEGLTTSRMYMNGTIRSWYHFCALRCGNGTQKETKELALAIRDVLAQQCPNIFTKAEELH
jgi:thymidylate synthase (FAD)